MASPSSQPLVDLFNVQAKDEVDDAISKFFFANGIPFHVACSLYCKEAMGKIIRVGPSYVPLREIRLRATILDQKYSKINILMEKMKRTWIRSRCSIVLDVWTDIRHRSLTNIMVASTMGPYFLKAIDCSGHHKDAYFQF